MSQTPREEVAIVGMSCFLPGADSPGRFWRNIVGKVDCVGEPTPDWQADWFVDPTGRSPDKCYTARGGYLGSLSRFNPARYGIMPSSVDGAEPDQFLAFRCAMEALEDAGFPEVPLCRERTGVIVGRGLFINRGMLTMVTNGFLLDQVVALLRQIDPERSEEQLAEIRAELKRHLPPFNAETVPGLTHNILAGRIANRLDLQGPAYMVDAACASALIALEQGLAELQSGRADAMIVGGVQVSTPGMVTQAFCYLEALSKTGRVAPFSAEANGTLLGQGCGMLVLKRRRDAERDGNRIYALVDAVGVASDGKGSGLLAPRQQGQELSLRRAYEQAGLDPSSIELVEAHGTGIPLGDATEIKTLLACFGPRRGAKPKVALGSVKSMISHLIPASGAASLIKTALALYHRVLPPMLHAENANPALHLNETPFYLSTEARPWVHPVGTPRRAAVNAFGFGGINAHAILEEHRPVDERGLARLERDWPSELVLVRAADREALSAQCTRLADWCEAAQDAGSEVALVDVAAALARQTGASRLAIVASDLVDLARKLRQAVKFLAEPQRQRIQDRAGIYWYAEPLGGLGAGKHAEPLGGLGADQHSPLAGDGRVAFVFPGEGAQYTGMLADLCRQFPEVRREFDLTDAAFERIGQPRLSQLIFPAPECAESAADELLELGGAVTSVTLASRGLSALLSTLGLRPDAIVGHSSGEFGALMAAGVISPADDEALVAALASGAQNAAELAHSGLVREATLVSVGGADPAAVERVLAENEGRLVVAMDNCPAQQVLSGDADAADAAIAALRGKGGLCEKLPWGRAYHTAAFEPAVSIVRKYYESVPLHAPRVELWSCATAARYPAEPDSVRELALRQWSSTVRFRETILAMYAAGVRVFIEVGPRGNLSAFIADTLGKQPHLVAPLDLPRRDGLTQLCRSLAMLAAHGVEFDLPALFARRLPRPIDFSFAPPAPARPDPVLKLELPELRLSPGVVEKVRRQPLQVAATSSPPAASAPVSNLAVALPVPAPPGASATTVAAKAAALASPAKVSASVVAVVAAQAQSPSGSNVAELNLATAGAPVLRVPVSNLANSADQRARALAEYQQTMRRFLQAQQRVMLAGLGVPGAGATFTVAAAAPAAASASGGTPHSPTATGNGSASIAGRSAGSLTSAATAPVPGAAKPVPSRASDSSRANQTASAPATSEAASVPAIPARVQPRTEPPQVAAHAQSVASTPGAAVATEPATSASLTDRLLGIVSDRTGYPAEMLDLDANLEADLGIDSIKRVEVIGAFRRAVLSGNNDKSDALMERLTGAKTLRAILDGVSEAVSHAAPVVTVATPRALGSASPFVFIENVLLHEPGRRLVAECELDIHKHRFLEDHTFFGRRLSEFDPGLIALPVMPLAMSLELLAEAAATLRPGLVLAALCDVQTLRWLAFETQSRRVRMEATEVDELHVRVKLSEADREGYSASIVEGVVEFSPAPVDLGPPQLPDVAQTPAPWAERMYDWILFHGPAFQGLVSLDACDPHGVRATVRQPAAPLFSPGEERPLLLPAALVDVAFQAPGMVYGNWQPSDPEVHMVYPNSFQRLEFASAPAAPGNQRVVATVDRQGQYLHTALEVIDGAGQVLIRGVGRVCQLVDFPTGIHHYSKSPCEVTCSREITELFAHVPFIEAATVCEIGHATGPILLNRVWSQALSRMILSRDERAQFAQLKQPPAAAASWLVGRIVAKDAVRLQTKRALPMADVRIIPNADRKPEAFLPESPGPLVSLGHKEFAAVAAAVDPARASGVGIDIELLGTMYPGLVDDAFNAHERAILEAAARAAHEPADHWRLSAWAAKEAVGKALGRGVLGGPRSIEVLSADPASGRLSLILRGQMAKAFPAYASAPGHETRIDAYRVIRGAHVIALCLLA